MTAPQGPSLAGERTRLARVRTVVALVLTAALVGRALLPHHPVLAGVAVPVAAVGTVLALRLGRARTGPAGAAALAGCVAVLALAGLALP
ncbi:hypothetical protein [Tsukamurella sp. 1534]|uniref:hypothetical protein n=1 Tax=Tsukamurella sp. 1534 TaxID=1151061 RepID=UPI0002D30754|nr:hypothetical protein [Tsukamurella sp. 1534]